MKKINQPERHKYNYLFLPGLPGKIKRFSFLMILQTQGVKYIGYNILEHIIILGLTSSL